MSELGGHDRGRNDRKPTEARLNKHRQEKQYVEGGGDKSDSRGRPKKVSGSDSRRQFLQQGTGERRHRVPIKANPAEVPALDQPRASLENINSRPDVPYDTVKNSVDDPELFHEESQSQSSATGSFEDTAVKLHGGIRKSARPNNAEGLQDVDEDDYRKRSRDRLIQNHEKSEILERYKEQLKRQSSANIPRVPIDYPDDAMSFEETLRPNEMAEICAVSKQKSFLLTLDQFLFILEKLEGANPSASIGQVSWSLDFGTFTGTL